MIEVLGTLAPGGYNLREGGGNGGKLSEEVKQKISESMTGENNPFYGQTHTDKTKQKISKSMSGENHPMFGQTHTEETKQKMSDSQKGENNPMFGRTLTDEHKQKLSDALSGENHPFYGQTRPDETKKKISDALKGEKSSASKKVYQYDIHCTFMQSFASGGEAARSLNKSDGSSISKCANGKLETAYGFKWSYTKL